MSTPNPGVLMHFSGQSAYELALTALDQGCVVALIPATYGGRRSIYMRYCEPADRTTLLAAHPDPDTRARFALALCHGSRDLACRRGFIPDPA